VKRILFVDDEPSILRGIQLGLRKDKERWSMEFALGAAAALAALQGEPFDVVVSDLHMHGVGGVGLLAQVRTMWPRTARVVLSGSVWQGIEGASEPLADEVLAKPCPTETLRACLERQLERREHDAPGDVNPTDATPES
jgi:DNA-binding NtrC family response regulator